MTQQAPPQSPGGAPQRPAPGSFEQGRSQDSADSPGVPRLRLSRSSLHGRSLEQSSLSRPNPAGSGVEEAQ